MRTVALLLLVSAACSAPAARNLVCERVAVVAPKAICAPEMSGVGPAAVHTARVTIVNQTPVVCGLDSRALEMACGPLERAPEAPEAKTPAPATK